MRTSLAHFIPPRTRVLLLLGAAAAALLLLASGLARVELHPGRPFPLGDLQQFLLDLLSRPSGGAAGPVALWRAPLLLLVWGVLPLLLVYLLIAPKRWGWLLRALLHALVWAIFLLMLLRFWRGLDPASPGSGAGPGAPRLELERLPAPPSFVVAPPQWLVIAVSLALVAALAGLLWLLWRRRPQPAPEPLELLAQEAAASLEQLRAGGDLNDTITRCYLEMSRILSQQGVQRRQAMTPREFERSLAAAGLRDEHIRRLTLLFERARYSPHAPGEREAREARACLEAIVAVYGSGP